MCDRIKFKSNHKIAVCMITTSFPRFPGDYPGIFVEKLADRLGDMVELSVLIPSDKDKLTILKSNYSVEAVRYFLKKYEDLFYRLGGLPQKMKKIFSNSIKIVLFIVSMGLKSLLKSHNSMIVHSHWSINGLFGILPKLINKTKLCITLHGSDMEMVRKKKLDRLLSKIIFYFSDALITVNKRMMEDVKKYFPSYKGIVVYIPNGADLIEESYNSSNRNKGIFKILFVGNIVPEKGIIDLQNVYEELCCKRIESELIIVGMGELYESVRNWAKSFSNVVMKGRLLNSEVIELMRSSNLLVLPSYNEGRPIVVLEAMANKLPILATTLPGISEIVSHKETGLLFKPGDRDNLRYFLERSINREEPLDEYAEKAYKFLINENLTWNACAESHYNLYHDLIMQN